MPDLDDRRLDAAIRDLVARAAADAPPAPHIDEHTVPMTPLFLADESRRDRRAKVVTAIAGLSIAAATVGLLVVNRDRTPEAPAPADTLPVTVPVTDPVPATTLNSTPPPTTAPTTTPTTAPVTAPATVSPVPEVIVIAGDDGIRIDTGDAITDAFVGESVTTAIRVPDGRIFFQYRSSDQPPSLSVIPAPDGTTPEVVPMPADFAGTAVLHDAAVVGGEVVLLVESAPGQCDDPNTCTGSVWAIWPDRTADAAAKLDEQNVWEAAYSRLSLSTTGVVVGMKSAEVSSSPWSVVLPGAAAEPLDPATVGLQVDYIDCATCPRGLTIDTTGRFVGWIERTEGTMTINVQRIEGGVVTAYEVTDTSDLAMFSSLDIGSVTIDDTNVISAGAIVNDLDPASDRAAVVFDLTDEGGVPIAIGTPASRMAFGF